MKTFKLIVISVLLTQGLFAQHERIDYAREMAATVMHIWPDSMEVEPGKAVKWAYDQGVVLEGITNIWRRTGKKEYFDYVKKSMDFFIQPDGTISRYKSADFNIDHIKNGRILLMLYRVTREKKYFNAAQILRNQLKEHPRTNAGGFWHKKIYPNQMWLDGLYMGQPFYAEFSRFFHEPENFDDIARQFILMEERSRDKHTGLMKHGWDESKTEKWADKNTGLSPHYWGRAMGWYGMGLVDVLENFPEDHPRRKELLDILERFAEAVIKVQEPSSGVWYQILDMPSRPGNYKESSASAMFVYTLAKARRLGYISSEYDQAIQNGFQGMVREFIRTDSNGRIHFGGTVSVAGLGGKPYRDGSYEYYLSEKVVENDPKGVGAFLLAGNEIELLKIKRLNSQPLVLLDSYFNDEDRSDITGKKISWHYKWDEMDNGGFGLFGEHIKYAGAKLGTLREAPTDKNLQQAAVYIIVDPDNSGDAEEPNAMAESHIRSIVNWVRNGGVLLLLANDAKNTNLTNLNRLSSKFGIRFNNDLKNEVIGNDFEMGKVPVPAAHPIFRDQYDLYLKEISTLQLSSPARPVLVHKGDNIMAVAEFGKGRVFALGDPWLYNEYIDGRKLPESFRNLQAGIDLISWMLENQVRK